MNNVIYNVGEMLDIIKQYSTVFLMIGFASRAQYKNLDVVVKQIVNAGIVLTPDTLILYGGDDARNESERGLGHLVCKLKQKFGCGVMGVVCDRDEYEPFIDHVVRVPVQHDKYGIVYTGFEIISQNNDKKNKSAIAKLRLKGNTRYYLAKAVQKTLTGVVICGGGGFGLEDAKLVVHHYTRVPYIVIKCSARYPSVYKSYHGPIYDYFIKNKLPLQRNKI